MISDEDNEFLEAINEYEVQQQTYVLDVVIKQYMFITWGNLDLYRDDDCLLLSAWIEE